MSDERRPKAPPETLTEVSTSRIPTPTIFCEVNAVYCSTFTVEQLLALGRIGACCRSRIDTDEVSV